MDFGNAKSMWHSSSLKNRRAFGQNDMFCSVNCSVGVWRDAFTLLECFLVGRKMSLECIRKEPNLYYSVVWSALWKQYIEFTISWSAGEGNTDSCWIEPQKKVRWWFNSIDSQGQVLEADPRLFYWAKLKYFATIVVIAINAKSGVVLVTKIS